MKHLIKFNPAFLIIAGMVIWLTVFTKCMDNQSRQLHTAGAADFNAYAGSATCANCHKAIYESHIKTGHFKTSALATTKNILGSRPSKSEKS